MTKPAKPKAKPTVEQLVAVVRAYQVANTRQEMNAADRKAEALIGPAVVK